MPKAMGDGMPASAPHSAFRRSRTLTRRTDPMKFDDTARRYGAASVILHWAIAAAVLVLLGLGLVFEDMPRGAEKLFLQNLHISIGACVALLFLFRAGWRLSKGFPPNDEGPAWERHAATLTHWLLIAALVVLATTGPLAPWSAGRAIDVFGWFTIPSPLPAMQTFHRAVETVHAITAKFVLLPLLVLHVAATLKHIFIDRASLWRRMIPSGPASD
jgi:cytochrome b561